MRKDFNKQPINDDLIERALHADRDALPQQPSVPNAQLLSSIRGKSNFSTGSHSHVGTTSILLRSIASLVTVSLIGIGIFLVWPTSTSHINSAPLPGNQRSALDVREDSMPEGNGSDSQKKISRGNHVAIGIQHGQSVTASTPTNEAVNRDLLMPKTQPKLYTNPQAEVHIHNSDGTASPAVSKTKQ